MTRRVLPDVSSTREQYPLWDGLFAYFPAALCEVARWSRVGGAKYNQSELRWVREVSTDHKNKILRHLLDAEKKVDGDFYEATALAWRSLALLQELLENDGWAEGENAKKETDRVLDEVRDTLVSAGNYSGECTWFSDVKEEYYT